MKKLILLLFLVSNLIWVKAQSVDSEKLTWEWNSTPLFKLPASLKSFWSNDYNLKFYDQTRNNSGGINLVETIDAGVSMPPMEKASPFMPEKKGYSQVYSVEVRTAKDKRLIYNRIFNKFGEIGVEDVTPGKPYDDYCAYGLSRQLSLLFSGYKNKDEFKLYTVKKSTAHDDINQAAAYVRNSVRMVKNDSIAQASQLMEKAVDIWNAALKESNMNDKKARINRKITEDLYRNLIPTLIMLNRFDEAQKLIVESDEKFGLFFKIFTSVQKVFMTKKIVSYKAITSKQNLTLADIELPDTVKLINSGTRLTLPPDIETIRKILVGSWRVVSEKPDMLPTPSETYDKNKCKKMMSWNFFSSGKLSLQEEGQYIDSLPNIKLNDEYWLLRRASNGKILLGTADSPKDFSRGSVSADEIVYCTLNKVVIKVENSNPDANADYYYYQLERINPLYDY